MRRSDAGHDTEDNARKVLAGILANMQAGRAGMPEKPRAPSPLFKSVADEWLDGREADDHRSIADDRLRWKNHLAPLLDPRQVDSVDVPLLLDLKRDLLAKLSPSTSETVLHLLSAFYRWAIVQGHAEYNPVKAMLAGLTRPQRLQLQSKHRPEDVPFVKTKEDVARIYQALPEPVNTAYALSALAGLRPGEVLGLEWADVDLERKQITVRRQVRHGHVDVPKSGKPRVIPIFDGLRAALTAWRAKNPEAVLVCPPAPYRKKDGTTRPRRNRHGEAKHLNLRTVYAALETALEGLKLPEMTFYEAGRHSFASLWVLAGQDIYRLSKIMGHSSVVVTERYAHLTRELPESVASAVDVALG